VADPLPPSSDIVLLRKQLLRSAETLHTIFRRADYWREGRSIKETESELRYIAQIAEAEFSKIKKLFNDGLKP